MSLLFIIPWIAAAAVAYYYLETIGCHLKKKDPTVYNEVKKTNDMTAVDDTIKNLEKERDQIYTAGTEAKKKLKDGEINESNSSEYQAAVKTVNHMIKRMKEIDEEVSWLNTVKEKGLDSIHWSIKNIAWTAGIFLVVGLVLHYMMKKIMSIFFTNKEN